MRLRRLPHAFQACQVSISIQALERGLSRVGIGLAAVVAADPVDVLEVVVGLDRDDPAPEADVAVPVVGVEHGERDPRVLAQVVEPGAASRRGSPAPASSSHRYQVATLSGRAVGLERGHHGRVGLAQQRLELVGDRRLRHGRAFYQRAWPAGSRPVRQDCDWKRSRSAVQPPSFAAWTISPPSCQTPSSRRNWRALPWFWWTSWMPRPGSKPKTGSRGAVRTPRLAERRRSRAPLGEVQVEELVEVVVRARLRRSAAGGTAPACRGRPRM